MGKGIFGIGRNKIVEKDDLNEFHQVVVAAPDLPRWARGNAASVRGFEKRILDHSYLLFLKEQIALEPRGPEWTKVLRKRLEALTGVCGTELMRGIVSEGDKNCFVVIGSEPKEILYWESWDFQNDNIHEPFNQKW
jgi:hypothetical protein